MRHPRSMKQLGISAVMLVIGACEDGTEPEPGPEVLAAVSGNGQSAEVGAAVADPLVVSVMQDGVPVTGTTVTWTVTAGGGSVTPATATTGSLGTASTTRTLGATAGTNAVEASATGVTGSPVAFTATGTAPPPPPPMLASVTVDDNFFDPTTQRVAAGGTVTWTWAGSVGHNVTFATGMNSATQASGTFSRAFPAAGSFDYECTIHSGMIGTITVE
jgi:plastocyanin